MDFDQFGRPIDARPQFTRRKMRVGSGGAQSTIGADIWEFFHPGQVQQEQAAVGARLNPDGTPIVDTQTQIMSDAASDIGANVSDTETQVGAGIQSAASYGLNLATVIVIGIVGWAAIKALDRVPSQGHVKRYANRQIKRARAHIAKRIGG